MPDPSLHPELYDAIVLGGQRSPGVVKLSGHDREQKWDIKDGKGQEAASSTHDGSKLAAPTCTFYLRNPEERAEWTVFAAVIRSMTSGSAATALAIYHPDLAENGIEAVSNGKIGGMVHDDLGGSTVVVVFQEYKAPKKKAASTPKGAGTAASGAGSASAGQQQDPNAAAKAELEALLREAEEP